MSRRNPNFDLLGLERALASRWAVISGDIKAPGVMIHLGPCSRITRNNAASTLSSTHSNTLYPLSSSLTSPSPNMGPIHLLAALAALATATPLTPRAPAAPRLITASFTGNGCPSTSSAPNTVSGSASRLTLEMPSFSAELGGPDDPYSRIRNCNAQLSIGEGVPGFKLAVRRVEGGGAAFYGSGGVELVLHSSSYWQDSPEEVVSLPLTSSPFPWRRAPREERGKRRARMRRGRAKRENGGEKLEYKLTAPVRPRQNLRRPSWPPLPSNRLLRPRLRRPEAAPRLAVRRQRRARRAADP